MKRIFTAFLLLLAGFAASAQSGPLSPDGTYVYEKRDTCDLFMDVYDPADGSEETFMGHRKPTIIFMFGGGFVGGQRDNQSYNSWFRQLTENGYRVISIDYRLGLKGASKMGIAQVNLLDKAMKEFFACYAVSPAMAAENVQRIYLADLTNNISRL